MNGLQFAGDWPPFFGLAVAILGALAAWLLYQREIRSLKTVPGIRALPWLRAGAVLLLLLMLTGPVLKLRTISGTLTRLLIFVDSSQSMGVSDPEMDVARKLAAVRSLGWLPATPEAARAEVAAESMTSAIRSVRKTVSNTQLRELDLHAALSAFSRQLHEALEPLREGTFSKAELEEIDRLLSAPLKRLTTRFQRASLTSVAVPKEFLALIDVASRWQITAVQKARDLAVIQSGGEKKVATALARFDQTPRTERVRSLLLDGGPESLLARLSPSFNVELLSLENNHPHLLWSVADGTDQLPTTLPSPESTTTNLGASLSERADTRRNRLTKTENARTAIVLFSDGQHNAKGSPSAIAKTLGDRGIPIYCVGLGSDVRPADMALLAVDTPQTIFYEDRVSGTATIKDDMPAGLAFEFKIMLGDTVVWKKDMISSQRSVLKVPFDFAVKELVAGKIAQNPSKTNVVPLTFEGIITPLSQEREIRNNSMRFVVKATTGKRRLLILDGRPRWEVRYIRNLFERDLQWHVNTLIADPESKAPWQRGFVSGTFPADEATLSEYDMVIFGEVPHTMLSEEEFQWLDTFVSKRGGGVLFLDGARHVLSSYGLRTPARLLPVTFQDSEPAPEESLPIQLELTERGRSSAAFKLEDNLPDSSEIWKKLPPPRRLARCTPLPGTETLLEGVTQAGRSPAFVLRQYGSGHVAYMAFDETWRWRNEVAGKYQERFWNQIISHLAEATFSTMDEQIALDTDAFTYAPGLTAGLRVRIRDGKTRNSVDGILWKEGKKHASVSLSPEPGRPNTFSGRSSPLEPGLYDFGVDELSGVPNSSPRVRFEVQAPQTGELGELTLNEELLVQMATDSHGKYLREERSSELPNLIEGLKTGHAIESEILLWQSYGWFAVVVLLLTAEWILRKRLGLI